PPRALVVPRRRTGGESRCCPPPRMSAGTKKILRDKVLLYAITPQHVGPTELGRVEELLQAGLGILQLRDKGQVAEREALARELRERCHRYNALFVVND